MSDPAARARFRSVLRNRQYLWFLAASNLGNTGYAVYAISIVWLAYTLSHDFLIVGVVLFIEYAAYTLTFVFAPLVDRVRNQRTIFVLSFPVQAVAAAILGWGAAAHFLTAPLLFAMVAALSILWDMTWAAMNAAPGVLLTPDEQFAASGIAGGIGGGLSIVGYVSGGALLVIVGPSGGMFLYAALLLAGTALSLPLRIHPPRSHERSFSESFREGWRLVVGGEGRPLLQLASVDWVNGFMVAAPAVLITLTAAVAFHGSSIGYGVLFTTDVVGGVAAGLALGQWNPRRRVGLILPAALLATGGAIALAVSLPPDLVLAGVAWFAVGFASAIYFDAKYAFYRGAVAPEQIARLISNMYLFSGVAGSIGALVLSDAANSGMLATLGWAIAAAFAAAGVVALALPGVRRMSY